MHTAGCLWGAVGVFALVAFMVLLPGVTPQRTPKIQCELFGALYFNYDDCSDCHDWIAIANKMLTGSTKFVCVAHENVPRCYPILGSSESECERDGLPQINSWISGATDLNGRGATRLRTCDSGATSHPAVSFAERTQPNGNCYATVPWLNNVIAECATDNVPGYCGTDEFSPFGNKCAGARQGHARSACATCANTTCPSGEYRSGSCSGTTDGYVCTPCGVD